MSRLMGADIRLFIERAVWIADQRRMTVGDFLEWITPYFSKIDRHFIEKSLRLFEPEQKTAERVLCELLSAALYRQQKVRTASTRISRNTNWPRTISKAFPQVPQTFHKDEILFPLDERLLGILAYIARGWIDLQARVEKSIGRQPGLSERRRKLQQVVDRLQSKGIPPCTRPLNMNHRRALQQKIKPLDQKPFFNSLNYWSSRDIRPVAENLTELLCEEQKDAAAENRDNLFEVTTHLCILYAAISAEWQLVDATDARYHLSKGNLHMILGKGRPERVMPENSDNVDRMLGIRKLATQDNPTGYQPDVVMGFYLEGAESDPLVIFGDAKNYRNSNIAHAYKETVCSTMIAYGHWAKLSIVPEQAWEDAFICPVYPFFTLFCIQADNSNRIVPPSEQKKNEKEPPVKTLELNHMRATDEMYEMDKWFNSIEQKIRSHFSQKAT